MRPVLAEREPGELTASDIFDVRKEIAAESRNVQANRHVSCLSAVFRAAVGWRCGVSANPCHELKRLPEPPRTRYVFDHEFVSVHGIASDILQCAMDLATLTGQREDFK